MTLSEGQVTALRNLARKKAGAEVGWVAIADARQLAELGLAVRNRSGWAIAAAGEAALEALGAGPAAGQDAASDHACVMLPFHPHPARA